MYSIAERTKLSKQIAQVSQIETYRSMLRGYGSKRAGRIILDQQLLAESLVYELLGKCTAEEILERTSNTRQSALHQPVNTAIVAVKKKLQNMRNIRQSDGRILKTLSFKLLTSYIVTVSTAIRDFVNSKALLVKHQIGTLWQNISGKLSGWNSVLKSSKHLTAQANSSESTHS